MVRSSRLAGGGNRPTDGKPPLPVPPPLAPPPPSPASGGGKGRGPAGEGRVGVTATETTHGSAGGARSAIWTVPTSPQSPSRSAAPLPRDLAMAVHASASTSKRCHGA